MYTNTEMEAFEGVVQFGTLAKVNICPVLQVLTPRARMRMCFSMFGKYTIRFFIPLNSIDKTFACRLNFLIHQPLQKIISDDKCPQLFKAIPPTVGAYSCVYLACGAIPYGKEMLIKTRFAKSLMNAFLMDSMPSCLVDSM